MHYDSKRKYPATFLLEANAFFSLLANTSDTIFRENEEQIIIGISFDPDPFTNERYLTNFTYKKLDGHPNSGNAETFKKILEEEVVPLCISKYALDPKRLSIVGHHFSAAWLTWLVGQEHINFANYIICSPVLSMYEDINFHLKLNKKNKTGIFISQGSNWTPYFDVNQRANKRQHNLFLDYLKSNDGKIIDLSYRFYETTLFYEDLKRGFEDGLAFISENNHSSDPYAAARELEHTTTTIYKRKIKSHYGKEYELTFSSIPATASPDLPVLFVLDGDFNYMSLLSEYKSLLDSSKISDILLVGIGYGTAIRDMVMDRRYDFTAKSYKSFRSGNAKNFYVFLVDSLIKNVFDTYALESSTIGITGHSFGGTFLTYALQKRSNPIDAFIISSPDIAYTKKALKKHSTSLEADILLGVGGIEDFENDAKKLNKILTKKVSGKYKFKRFEDCDHGSVIPAAFREGLLFLY